MCLQFACSFLGLGEDDIYELRLAKMCSCSEHCSNEIFRSRLLSVSFSTLKTYTYPLRRFFHFLTEYKFVISNHTISLYVMNMVENSNTVGTVTLFFNAFAFFNSFYDLKIELSRQVTDLKKFALKSCPEMRKVREAFGEDQISVIWDKFFENLNSRTIVEIRTFVMIVVLHKSFCRFSCLSNVKLDHISYSNEFFKIRIPFSKTDLYGVGENVYIPNVGFYKNAHWLLCWYIHLFDLDGDFYLFPPVEWMKSEKSWKPVKHRMLSYSAAYTSFKNLLKKFGLCTKRYSLHSMRMGGATDAFRNGISGDVIDRQGRWKCPNSKYRYVKKTENQHSNELKFASMY